jgi:uncharacterized protein (DUF1499 family)
MNARTFTQLKRTFYGTFSIALALSLVACSGSRPAYLGSPQTALQLCPSSPNCVSSLDNEEASHKITPLPFQTAGTNSAKLSAAIQRNPSAEIVVNTESYIYAEYTSDIMGYVDDVEFLIIPSQQRIDVRSASRLGHSDFGVNRQRIEQLRKQLSEN